MGGQTRIAEIDGDESETAPLQDRELLQLRDVFFALRRSMLLIIALAGFSGVAAFMISAAADQKFSATSQVMIDTRIVANPEFTPHVSGLPTNIVSVESELEVLRSTDLIERVVKRLNVLNHPEFKGISARLAAGQVGLKDQIVDRLTAVGQMLLGAQPSQPQTVGIDTLALENVIEAVEKSRVIQQVGTTSAVYAIKMTTGDPLLSAEIANALAQEYLAAQTEAKVESLERSQDWLSVRIGNLSQDLNVLSRELEAHAIDAPFSPEEYATIRARRVTVQRQLEEVDAEIDRLLRQQADVTQRLDDGELNEAWRLVAANDEVFQVRLDAEPAPGELREAVQDEVVEIAADIAELETRREDLLQSASELREAQALQGEHMAETRRIAYEISVAEAIYQDFVSQLSRRTEQDRYLNADARIIETARPATEPSAPRKKLAAVSSAAVAALLSTLLVIIYELTQTRMRTLREFEEAAGLPLVTFFREQRGKTSVRSLIGSGTLPRQMEAASRKLMLSLDSAAASGTPLGLTRPEDPGLQKPALDKVAGMSRRDKLYEATSYRVIAGAATAPGDGLTTTLLALGVMYARTGRNVLYIDGNPRNSMMNSYLRSRSIEKRTPDEFRALIRDNLITTETPGLKLLPYIDRSGWNEHSTEELLVWKEGREALDDAAREVDIVIIDTPPILRNTRSLQYLLFADQIVLCLRWNHTTRAECGEAIRILRDLDLRPKCIVSTRSRLRRARLYGDEALTIARSSV
jgi:uncharacterized protein involved in exopolysaccharide biosynthesis/Mrp family chromosome partitioning ATPase